MTGHEKALLADGVGTVSEQVVEPATQYGMARVSRDFREGRSAVGMISTWTRRDPGPAAQMALHQGAYTGGIDARHRFGSDLFIVSAYLLGSTMRGSDQAIERTQRSPTRYYQRPDADHTELDPTRTSLSGWAGSVTLAKISGGYWGFATGAMARSPGFDSNDLGFQREADFVAPFVWIGSTRVDWTFSPTLSLQIHAEPFVSAGDYGDLRRIADPRADAYADRFAHVHAATNADGTTRADIDGDGTVETFRNPDFNFKQFRSNAVLRWEYRPGSVLFAVWSQGRDHFARTGDFSLGGNLGTLFRQPGEDVFMVKLSYWIG